MAIKLNIASPTSFTAHRAGWGYAMNFLMKYHDYDGILLDDFIDITFGYNYLDNKKNKKIPYKKPWIGFLHHPPSICPWYEESYRNNIDINVFLNSEEFQISAKYCQCLFVLSDYLKDYLVKHIKCLKNVPIIAIKHPTESHVYRWDFKKFKALYKITGLKVVGIGYFLRSLTSLFLLESSKNLDKIMLPSHLNMALSNLDREIQFKELENKINHDSVKIIGWQSHEFYDKLLEQSLVFLDLYDTSCNNAIIESIVRSCPLLVNRHPAIEEYLGKKYPLFYKDFSDIDNLMDYSAIENASEYLSNLNLKEFSGEYFADHFEHSLLDLGIFNKKSLNHKSHKYSAANKEYRVLNKSTDFDHRFGWSWVMENISCSIKNQKIANNKKAENLYINDFTEHVFKVDNINQTKDIVIDNQRHRAIRGYNMFSYNNSDLVNINNNEYYLWSNTDNAWVLSQESEAMRHDLSFLKISTFKNNDWVGFVHNPPNMPNWFDYGQNFAYMMKNNSDFILSLHRCKKIFVLSEHMKPFIEQTLSKYRISVPVVCLKHPVPKDIDPENLFNYDAFMDEPKIVQLGYWVRKMHSFWQIDCDMQKWWLYGHPFAIEMLKQEKIHNKKYQSLLSYKQINNIQQSVAENQPIKVKNVNVARVSNEEYDRLLKSSVGFLNLYDTSANNGVIECISTQTPLLINRLPATKEYLGDNYPLFFNNINHANKILKDHSRILEAHLYLKEHKELKSQLSIDLFLSEFNKELRGLCKK